MSLLNSLENNMAAVPDEINSTKQKVQHVLQLAEALVPKMEDVKVKEIGDLVENEMQSTTAAIEAAAQKMQVGTIKCISVLH